MMQQAGQPVKEHMYAHIEQWKQNGLAHNSISEQGKSPMGEGVF
jgi:hypothetical protein